MEDRELVAAMVGGDPRGLEEAYRTYAPSLYGYCRRLLLDLDAAADVVHDTFVLAGQRAGQLREPDRLPAWLFAIARNECLRHLRQRTRLVPLEEAGEVPTPVVEPTATVAADQTRELVWAAAQALNESDRHVFELMVRHNLSAADVSAVLGVSVDNAHARMSRARTQLGQALGVLLVARTGAKDCADLGALLHGWDGALTSLMRKRISRHVDACVVCARRRDDETRPAALLAAYGSLPILLLPAGLWARIARSSTAGAPPDTLRLDPRTGFPPPVAATSAPIGPLPTATARRPVLIAGMCVLALLLLGSAVPILARVDPSGLASPLVTDPSAPSAPATTASSTGPTPAGTEPAASQPGEPGPVAKTPTPARTRATVTVTPTVAATAQVVPQVCPQYAVIITAKLSGAAMASASVWWTAGSGAPVSKPMAVSGATATVVLTSLVAPAVTWWVVVTTVGKGTIATPHRTTARSCLPQAPAG